ncbi:MAG: PEP-CTERM sorting domain-containing protein [Gammaproteobacteria bacterium]|nr:PEP-CTERM sorting domain-containing protein [Gammaproteobacteria bacterium]
MLAYTRHALIFALLSVVTTGQAATIYDPGVAPAAAASGLVFGDHLLIGPHVSVAGVGGSGLSDAGDALNGARTYIYDLGAQADLTDGLAVRGVAPFAMMIWDMGAAYDSMRLYTHQDHYSGGPVTTNFVGQDLMEYSVWGSHDGDTFVLLSDVIGFDLDGGGVGVPTYSFGGTAPTVVYRGGSTEFGILNAYTREYVFPNAYRYYGIRTSQISLTIPGGGTDADPELDTIAAFNTLDRCRVNPQDVSCQPPVGVPEPTSLVLLGLGLAATGWRIRRRHRS